MSANFQKRRVKNSKMQLLYGLEQKKFEAGPYQIYYTFA